MVAICTYRTKSNHFIVFRQSAQKAPCIFVQNAQIFRVNFVQYLTEFFVKLR